MKDSNTYLDSFLLPRDSIQTRLQTLLNSSQMFGEQTTRRRRRRTDGIQYRVVVADDEHHVLADDAQRLAIRVHVMCSERDLATMIHTCMHMHEYSRRKNAFKALAQTRQKEKNTCDLNSCTQMTTKKTTSLSELHAKKMGARLKFP